MSGGLCEGGAEDETNSRAVRPAPPQVGAMGKFSGDPGMYPGPDSTPPPPRSLISRSPRLGPASSSSGPRSSTSGESRRHGDGAEGVAASAGRTRRPRTAGGSGGPGRRTLNPGWSSRGIGSLASSSPQPPQGGEWYPLPQRDPCPGSELRAGYRQIGFSTTWYPPAGASHPHLSVWGERVHGPAPVEAVGATEEERRMYMITCGRGRRHACLRNAKTDTLGVSNGADGEAENTMVRWGGGGGWQAAAVAPAAGVEEGERGGGGLGRLKDRVTLNAGWVCHHRDEDDWERGNVHVAGGYSTSVSPPGKGYTPGGFGLCGGRVHRGFDRWKCGMVGACTESSPSIQGVSPTTGMGSDSSGRSFDQCGRGGVSWGQKGCMGARVLGESVSRRDTVSGHFSVTPAP